MPKSDQPQWHLPASRSTPYTLLPTVKVAADQTCPAKPKLAGGPHELWFATLAARAAFATRLSVRKRVTESEQDLRQQEWIRLRSSGRHITQGLQASHYGCQQPRRELWPAGFVKAKQSQAKTKTKATGGHNQEKIELWSEGKKVSTPTQSIIASNKKGPRPYLSITLHIFLKERAR